MMKKQSQSPFQVLKIFIGLKYNYTSTSWQLVKAVKTDIVTRLNVSKHLNHRRFKKTIL